MKRIFIIGAGLSATVLIDYLLEHSVEYDWNVTVGDISFSQAQEKISAYQQGRAIKFDIFDPESRTSEISNADIVVSMLPGAMHPIVAKECLHHGKHMLSPSYVTPELRSMDADVRAKGLLFLNELGVDPGIDHMSAMRVIDGIKKRGGKLLSFKSFCGGLVAPDCDDNPWKYKFSWNPRNVVLAGQGVARYRESGQYRYVPYHHLFSTLESVDVAGYGEFEVYPNRDSLQYCDLYGLENIPTILRGTMRRPGFSAAWDVFVQLGCTDDSYIMENSQRLTYRQFIQSFLPYSADKSIEECLADYIGIPRHSEIIDKISWLGLFSAENIGLENATPATIMQKILVDKWSMSVDDRDLLVMQHQFIFEQDAVKKKIVSSMTYEGVDSVHTAMATTVGFPLAIATKLLAMGKIDATGIQLPLAENIYVPILDELESLGVRFIEEERSI